MSKEKKSNGVAHQAIDQVVKMEASLLAHIGKFQTEMLSKQRELVEKHNNLAAQITAVEGITQNIAAFTASEMGRMGGTLQKQVTSIGEAANAIDLNVLALAELLKEVVGQLTQVDTIFKKLHSSTKDLLSLSVRGLVDEDSCSLPQRAILNNVREYSTERHLKDVEAFNTALELSSSEIQEIKANSEKWYQDLVASSFKTVRERMEADDKAAREREAEAVKIAKEKAEQVAAAEAEAQNVEKELRKASTDEHSIAAYSSGGSGSPFPEGADIFGG